MSRMTENMSESYKDAPNSNWKSSLTATLLGMCHTLEFEEPMKKRSMFSVSLKGNFVVMLHDPRFFLLKTDNFFVPHLTLTNSARKGYIVKVVTKKRLNRDGKFECTIEAGYNLGNCVKRSVAKQIGCNSPWTDYSLDNLPFCNTTTQMRAYETLYSEIFYADQYELHQLTKCRVPCSYQEYSLMRSPMSGCHKLHPWSPAPKIPKLPLAVGQYIFL